MKVMAQIAMVMNLDKCIGCHTCSVTCKQAWTNREGTEYMWFNNVETRPGVGYPQGLGGPGALEGRLDAHRQRPSRAPLGRAPAPPGPAVRQPGHAHGRGLLRAVDLRVRQAPVRPQGLPRPAGGARQEPADGRVHAHHLLGPQLGRRPGRVDRDPGRRPGPGGHELNSSNFHIYHHSKK